MRIGVMGAQLFVLIVSILNIQHYLNPFDYGHEFRWIIVGGSNCAMLSYALFRRFSGAQTLADSLHSFSRLTDRYAGLFSRHEANVLL